MKATRLGHTLILFILISKTCWKSVLRPKAPVQFCRYLPTGLHQICDLNLLRFCNISHLDCYTHAYIYAPKHKRTQRNPQPIPHPSPIHVNDGGVIANQRCRIMFRTPMNVTASSSDAYSERATPHRDIEECVRLRNAWRGMNSPIRAQIISCSRSSIRCFSQRL